MAIYFADTSFWIALIDQRDFYHSAAIELSRSISGGIVTTQAVLLETANAFAKPLWRDKAIAMINHLGLRDDVEVIPFSRSLWTRGWELFVHRPDKTWSLTDFAFRSMSCNRGSLLMRLPLIHIFGRQDSARCCFLHSITAARPAPAGDASFRGGPALP
jgi:predicted nucleic acid-binding protein